MASVTLHGITKKFGDLTVIEDLDMEIKDGRFVVLVGPSGCGKSTTLRMIAGLESITKGVIRIGDRIVNDVPPKNRGIAMVFQNYALYPHMNVFDNMAFGLKLRGVPKPEIRERVEEAGKVLGIESLLGRKPKELSGGQRQRVAVGRAIVRKAEVFLFDEPLSNLDAKLRVQMRAEINLLHSRLKTTMIYVTHDQVEAMTMGDEIVIMDKGEIQQVGSPLDVYDRPVNRFTATFIGSPAMNLFDAAIVRERAVTTLRIGDAAVSVSADYADRLNKFAGREIQIGVRPENILIGNDKPGLGPFPGFVDVVEPMGSETYVHFRIAETKVIVRAAPAMSIKPFEHIEWRINPAKIHVFDAAGGETL